MTSICPGNAVCTQQHVPGSQCDGGLVMPHHPILAILRCTQVNQYSDDKRDGENDHASEQAVLARNRTNLSGCLLDQQ